MSSPTVNGDSSHSQTISHLTNYPLVSEILKTYQSNSLGAKTISAYNSAYTTFVDPVKPYLQTPYSIVSPYLETVDGFGDRSLSTIDNHFPALKSTDFEKLKGTTYDVVSFPFKVAGSTRDYAFTTYNDEYKKTGGEGVVTSGKALISTQIRIAAEALQAIGNFLGPKKDDLQANYEKVKKNGLEKVGQAQSYATEKTNQAKGYATEKTDQGKKVTQEKAEQAKQHANNVNSH